MGKGFLGALTDEAFLSAGAGRPIVELAGDSRVLIEHHFGVKEYGAGRITVKMRYGELSVEGEGLEILRMTKDQLVIRGTILALTLHRRKKP